jgi:hypothetical protein
MLNQTKKKIVYLDSETLRYMFYTYTGERVYPVMKKLYTVLNDGFMKDWLVVPLSIDQVLPYIKDNKVENAFLSMMGGIGQVQFHQRFTIKTLQLIRILNHFFDNSYSKPLWQDAFTSDPGEKFRKGFNRYTSISAQNVFQTVSREKNCSQVFEFIKNYKSGNSIEKVAAWHFRTIWDQFPDLIRPFLPSVGAPENHLNKFLDNEDIRDIPEFHIMATVLYPMVDTYGFERIAHGLQDEELLAAESISAYLPYCHYYVTKVDIAEILTMSDVQETYSVRVYDNNESSLFKLIHDFTEEYRNDLSRKELQSRKTIFQKGGTKL